MLERSAAHRRVRLRRRELGAERGVRRDVDVTAASRSRRERSAAATDRRGAICAADERRDVGKWILALVRRALRVDPRTLGERTAGREVVWPAIHARERRSFLLRAGRLVASKRADRERTPLT